MDAQLGDGDRQGAGHPECTHEPRDAAGCSRRYSVSEQYTPQTESHVCDDEPNAERIMGNQPHIPRVRQESHGSAGSPKKGRIHFSDRTTQNKDCIEMRGDESGQERAGDVCSVPYRSLRAPVTRHSRITPLTNWNSIKVTNTGWTSSDRYHLRSVFIIAWLNSGLNAALRPRLASAVLLQSGTPQSRLHRDGRQLVS